MRHNTMSRPPSRAATAASHTTQAASGGGACNPGTQPHAANAVGDERECACAPERRGERQTLGQRARHTVRKAPLRGEFGSLGPLHTLICAEEVVAHARPTEGSNLATSSHARGGTPVVDPIQTFKSSVPHRSERLIWESGSCRASCDGANVWRAFKGVEAVLQTRSQAASSTRLLSRCMILTFAVPADRWRAKSMKVRAAPESEHLDCAQG